jgi:hypothetical protein
VLAEYRAFAGQLGKAPDGTPAVLLNNHGARFMEATVGADLVDMALAKPTPEPRFNLSVAKKKPEVTDKRIYRIYRKISR